MEREEEEPKGDGSPDEGWDELMCLDVPHSAPGPPRDAPGEEEASSSQEAPRILRGDALKAWFLDRIENAQMLAPEETVVFGVDGPSCSRAVVVFPRTLPLEVLEQAMGELFGLRQGEFTLLAKGSTLFGRNDWYSFVSGTVVSVNPRMPRWVITENDIALWEAHICNLSSVIREDPVCVGM